MSRVSPGRLHYLFLDISPTSFSNIFSNTKKLDNRKYENPKTQAHEQEPRSQFTQHSTNEDMKFSYIEPIRVPFPAFLGLSFSHHLNFIKNTQMNGLSGFKKPYLFASISHHQIFHYRDFWCYYFFLENMVVIYRGIDNKGVLGRPWTKWRVLRAISSTLKFQFTVNPES